MMTEIDAIKKRHSVRKYEDKKIEPEIIEQLKAKIDELNAAGNIRLVFVEEAGNTFNKLLNRAMGLGSAPSLIACIGPDDETVDERIGYYGEQLVLLAQQLGLNTCWAGTFNRKNIPVEVAAGEKLAISIAIGYGANQGIEGRKSKTAAQVSKVIGEKPAWFDNAVELCLMAPTAINQQKFEIICNNGEIEFVDKGGVLSQIDLGIIKYHFEVGKNA